MQVEVWEVRAQVFLRIIHPVHGVLFSLSVFGSSMNQTISVFPVLEGHVRSEMAGWIMRCLALQADSIMPQRHATVKGMNQYF
jgi:hypothetical protein